MLCISRSDLFAAEIIDGDLYVIIKRDDNVRRRRISSDVSDGNAHTLAVTFRSWGAGAMVRQLPRQKSRTCFL